MGNQNNQTTGNTNRVDSTNIGKIPVGQLREKYEYVDGYYRFQKDEQPVISRSEEQLKILREFFIIENMKTTICNPDIKKRARLFGILSIVMLVAGILMFLASLMDLVPYVGIVAIVCFVLCIVFAILKAVYNKSFAKSVSTRKHPRVVMEDETYEALVEKKIDEMNVASLARERLGIDDSQIEVRPIIIKANANRDYTLKYYNKDTNKLYTSTQSVTLLFFTDEQLFVYKMVFDMCCDMQEEYASEFFYDDICDLSSKIKKNILTIGANKFEYSTISFEIIVSNSSISFQLEGTSDRLESVQAMKQKIREKRNRNR